MGTGDKSKEGVFRDDKPMGEVPSGFSETLYTSGPLVSGYERRDRLEALFQGMSQGVVFQDKDGKITMANAAAERILGLTRDQLFGRTSHDPRWEAIDREGNPFRGEDHPAMRSLQSGRPVNNVLMGVYNPAERRRRWIMIDSVPLFEEEGELPSQAYATFTDVTAQVEAENALIESERKYRELIESSNELITRVDAEGTFTYVNPAALKFLGLPPEKLVGMKAFDFIHPDDRDNTLRHFDEWTKGDGGDIIFENRQVSVTGEVHDMLWIIHPLLDGKGEVEGFSSVAVDVTERKKAQREKEALARDLGQTKNLLESILNSIPDIIGVQDLEHNIIRYNHSGYKFLEITPGDLPGRKCYEIIGRDKPCRVCATSEVYQTRLPSKRQKFIPEFGVWFDLRAYPVFDDSGNLVQVIEHIRDITAERSAIEAIEKSEESYREIFNSTATGLMVHDAETGQILDVNQTIVDMTGYDRESILQSDVGKLSLGQAPYSQNEALSLIHKVKSEGPQTFDWMVRKKDGVIIWVEVTLKSAKILGRDRILAVISDITERKKYERDIIREKELSDGILDSLPGIFYMFDSDGKLLRWNRNFETVTGYSESELADKYILDYFEGGDREEIFDRFREVFINGWAEAEAEMIMKDGSRVAYYYTGMLARLDGRDYVLGVGLDVSERKKIELELKASEEKYRQLIETTNTGFTIVDAEGVVLDANDEYARIAGRADREEIMGRSVIEWTAPHDLERNKRALKAVLAKGHTRNLEIDYVAPGGLLRPVEINATVIETGEGKRIMTLCRDVSAKKKAEEERDRMFNLSMDLLSVSGFDGYFRQVNPAWTRTLGWSEEELLKSFWLDLVHPNDLESTREAGRELARGKEIRGFKNRMRTKSGEYRRLSWSSFPLPSEKMVFSVIRDVTEMDRLEEQLRQSQKMEAIGKLAGGVAHDFNNQLMVILNVSEMMAAGMSGSDPKRKHLSMIQKAGEQSASLTRQLLAFSRKQVIEPRVVKVNHMISPLREMLERLIGEDVEFEMELGSDAGLVKVDPSQIGQAIFNLAVNARDAMPRGGKLTISTGSVLLDSREAEKQDGLAPGNYALISVSDTGEGMDEETRSRIFEPFFTTKGLGKGTGLGLATVYGIVRQCEGSVTVSSEPGRGTTFRVYLPEAKAMDKDSKSFSSRASANLEGNETILVVEDNEDVRKTIVSMLRAKGYIILEAESGRQAEALFGDGGDHIDMVITDVVMPRLSGRELAKKFLEKRPDLPVLYVSGYTDEVISHHGVLEAGASLLQKPFTMDELLAKTRSLLDAR